MTIVLDDGSMKCGTHVLLIGVGDYPFLKDGSAPAADRFKNHMQMGQLGSPPESAYALARWFLDRKVGFNNPVHPLRSLAMLCSDAKTGDFKDPGNKKHSIDKATMHIVDAAVNAWSTRAGRNEKNLAIFYFCGHGLSFGEAENSLLLQDFGSRKNNPMHDAIFFDGMRMGLMNHCAARHFCYFVDACRIKPNSDFEKDYGTAAGNTIVAGGVSSKIRGKVAPAFFATRLGSGAYGDPKQPSLFAQGMLKGFKGPSSRDKHPYWEVSVPAVAEGINKCIESLTFGGGTQFCEPRDTGFPLLLHRLRQAPEVIVKVWCRKVAQLAQTRFFCTCQRTKKKWKRDLPVRLPWWVPLPGGDYLFEGMLDSHPAHAPMRLSKAVAPPASEVRF